MQATSLPFIVAATAIGLQLKLIDAAESAALVAAGLLSVLAFPVVSLALLREGMDRGAEGDGAAARTGAYDVKSRAAPA
jgi:hypothetical protein